MLFGNSRWRRPAAIFDLHFRHISVVNKDYCIKFGVLVDIGHAKVTGTQITLLVKLKMVAI